MNYANLKESLDRQDILAYSNAWVHLQKSVRFVLCGGVEVAFDASQSARPTVESKEDDLFLRVKVWGTEGRDVSIAIHNILYFEVTWERK